MQDTLSLNVQDVGSTFKRMLSLGAQDTVGLSVQDVGSTLKHHSSLLKCQYA